MTPKAAVRLILCAALIFCAFPACVPAGEAVSGFDQGAEEFVSIETSCPPARGMKVMVYHETERDYHEEEIVTADSDSIETRDVKTGIYRSYDLD